MENCAPALVDRIRAASRRIVRELGFMQTTLAATEYPPSAVHAILETGMRRTLTAAQLAELLGLEKSSVSRMVRKLIEAGELKETVSDDDARAKLLALTAKGQRTMQAIQNFGRQQVNAALAHMPRARWHSMEQGLAAYAQALEDHRLAKEISPAATVEILTGYHPGVIGRVTEMHARFYSRTVGFGQFFESLVATGMAEFAPRLAHSRNGLWIAQYDGRIAGSVAIDGEDLGENIAHLRWFIVDDDLRGAGAGRQLLAEAIAFCDRRRFSAIHLWTFSGLDAAGKLYRDAGFVLEEERPGRQWGAEVIEQRFVRSVPFTSPAPDAL